MMGNPWKNGNFTYDLKDNQLFRKDADNVIYALGLQQVNTVGNLYFLDIYLSADQCVEMHYHPNASELTYCISGRVEVSFINPSEEEWQRFVLEPGEAISIPQGFWHMACALENDTHLLATHDNNMLQTVFGSDLLRLTPDELLAHIYCLDENMVEETLRPITDTVIIGPPADCERDDAQAATTVPQQMAMTEEKESRRSIQRSEDNRAKAMGTQPAVTHHEAFGKAQIDAATEVEAQNITANQPMPTLIHAEKIAKLPVINKQEEESTNKGIQENDQKRDRTKQPFVDKGAGVNPDVQRYPFRGRPQIYMRGGEKENRRPFQPDGPSPLQEQKTVPYGGSLMQPVHLCKKCLPQH